MSEESEPGLISRLTVYGPSRKLSISGIHVIVSQRFSHFTEYAILIPNLNSEKVWGE